MSTITIQEVTRDNWLATLKLAVHPEQQRFVASSTPIAAIALAKAYVRPGGLIWSPYAIYADAQMVGFIELAYQAGSHDQYWIFHFFIDKAHQGQGYGKQALHAFIEIIKIQHPACQRICLAVHPENIRAQRFYTSLGFQPTEQELSGEPVYVLPVR